MAAVPISQVTKFSIFRKALDGWRYNQIANSHNNVSKQRIEQIVKEIRNAILNMDDWPGTEEQKLDTHIKSMRVNRDVWITALTNYHNSILKK